MNKIFRKGSVQIFLIFYKIFINCALNQQIIKKFTLLERSNFMREKFIIDGRNFSTLKEFYDEVERVFTFDLDWKIGRNLDAFNDILRGGFGRHSYGAPILIQWLNYEKSEKDLGSHLINEITEIILLNNSGHDCILEKL